MSRSRAAQANPRAVFGNWVTAVDQAIEEGWQQRRFRKKPIGPVGEPSGRGRGGGRDCVGR